MLKNFPESYRNLLSKAIKLSCLIHDLGGPLWIFINKEYQVYKYEILVSLYKDLRREYHVYKWASGKTNDLIVKQIIKEEQKPWKYFTKNDTEYHNQVSLSVNRILILKTIMKKRGKENG